MSHTSFTFAKQNSQVLMDTSMGQVTIELFDQEAPKTVANFLAYIHKDGYKNTHFHRVIKDFMVQGGGFSATTGKRADTLAPIQNESNNGISNQRGTISMARTNDPHSASRQFFINHKSNDFLDANGSQWGYAVFGKVTQGMDVIDEIAQVRTGAADKPLQTVTINSITLLKP